MFYFRAYSATSFGRYAANSVFTKQARLWTKIYAPIIKISQDNSYFSTEKQVKVAKNKKSNEKKFESTLYPEEMDKLNVYDVVKEFHFLDDDDSGKAMKPNETPKSDTAKIETNELEKIKEEETFPTETKEVKKLTDYLSERVSDSESESDTEFDGRSLKNERPKRKSRLTKINLNDLHINYLLKRDEFLKNEMEKSFKKNDIILQDVDGLILFAERNIYPKSVFFASFQSLSNFPLPFTNIPMYKIAHEDLKYWAPGPGKLNVLAIYDYENIRNACVKGPYIPIKVVCFELKKRITVGNILHSASLGCPELFLTSKGTADPWHLTSVRNGGLDAITMNCKFNLSWEEIKETIDKNDKVLLLEAGNWFLKSDTDFTNEQIPIPSMNIYKQNLWDCKSIALIVTRKLSKFNASEVLEFCLERNAHSLDVGIHSRRVMPSVLFNMVFFELRRQWLLKNSGTDSRSRAKKEKKEVYQSQLFGESSEITIR